MGFIDGMGKKVLKKSTDENQQEAPWRGAHTGVCGVRCAVCVCVFWQKTGTERTEEQ